MSNMKKKPIDNVRYFTALDLIWLKFCPKITPTLIFCCFPMKYVTGFH